MNLKESWSQFFENVKKHFVTVITVSLVLQAVNLLSMYIFRKTFLPLSILLFLMVFLSYLFYKNDLDVDQKKYGFRLFRVSFFLLAFSVINTALLKIGGYFPSPEKAHSFFNMGYFLNFIVLILLLTERFQNIYNQLDNGIFEFLKKDKPKDAGQGDVKLCSDAETNKPVFLKYKDRFLHMLILGPTGSGKTSQVILPLVNQDIQNFEVGVTVIEPKGDLAEKVYAMAQFYKRPAIYFNPTLPDCPYFNPLFGKEDDVIENMATTFKMLNPDSPQFFLDMNENLVRQSLKVLKRLKGNKPTLIDLGTLIQNPGGAGRKMVMEFSRIATDSVEIAKENADIAAWFLNDYFNEKSKTYDNCSGIRSQVAKITSNAYLRKVLNPPNGENDIDFDKHLAEGGVLTISTAQGELRDLSRYLGYFIILQLQSAVFRRPGSENTRRANFLYIDEFQSYSNPGFADMLTQGRSYHVASHLATQNRALMAMGGGKDGKNFVELVSTNARNIILFPGANYADAKFYSDQFGQVLNKKMEIGVTRDRFSFITMFNSIGNSKESLREVEKLEARFTPSDIIYRPFGEITFCIIDDNSVQFPTAGKIEYIPKDLNQKLDSLIEERKEYAGQIQIPIQYPASQPVVTDVEGLASDRDVVIYPVAPVKNEPKIIKAPEDPSEDDDEVSEVMESAEAVEKTTHQENHVENYNTQKDLPFMGDEEDELI